MDGKDISSLNRGDTFYSSTQCLVWNDNIFAFERGAIIYGTDTCNAYSGSRAQINESVVLQCRGQKTAALEKLGLSKVSWEEQYFSFDDGRVASSPYTGKNLCKDSYSRVSVETIHVSYIGISKKLNAFQGLCLLSGIFEWPERIRGTYQNAPLPQKSTSYLVQIIYQWATTKYFL